MTSATRNSAPKLIEIWLNEEKQGAEIWEYPNGNCTVILPHGTVKEFLNYVYAEAWLYENGYGL